MNGIRGWLSVFAGFILLAGGTAWSQSYPSRPVRIIVPTLAGGVSDVLARMLAERFSKEMGQNFIVDNRGSGNGIVGNGAAARAAPDGYTLLLTSDVFLVNHWQYTNLSYNSFKDFTLITPLTRAETLLVVHPSVASSNLKDFIAYARANPGQLNLASGSIGGDLKNYRFIKQAGAPLTNVTYKGAAPAMVDLLGGTLHVGLFSVGVLTQHVKSGKLKALGISGDKRDAVFPDVPTFVEADVKDFDPAGPLQAPLLAPSKTPRDIVEKLNAQTRKILADPEVIAWLARLSFTPVPLTVPESAKLLPVEIERYGRLFKDAGLKPVTI